MTPEILRWLSSLGVGLAVDQPLIGQAIAPRRKPSPIGYVRLHRRNYKNVVRETTCRPLRLSVLGEGAARMARARARDGG